MLGGLGGRSGGRDWRGSEGFGGEFVVRGGILRAHGSWDGKLGGSKTLWCGCLIDDGAVSGILKSSRNDAKPNAFHQHQNLFPPRAS